jgi:hypothetical protein
VLNWHRSNWLLQHQIFELARHSFTWFSRAAQIVFQLVLRRGPEPAFFQSFQGLLDRPFMNAGIVCRAPRPASTRTLQFSSMIRGSALSSAGNWQGAVQPRLQNVRTELCWEKGLPQPGSPDSRRAVGVLLEASTIRF